VVATLVIALVIVILAVGLGWLVYRLKPETFKISARFFRWFALDIEIRQHEGISAGHSPVPSRGADSCSSTTSGSIRTAHRHWVPEPAALDLPSVAGVASDVLPPRDISRQRFQCWRPRVQEVCGV